MSKKKKNNGKPQEFKEDTSDLDRSFRGGKKSRGNKRRDEKRYIREVKDGKYGGEFIDNFEKWN
jgi:hypothetical protein